MKVGVAAHCECCDDLKFTVLPDEFQHDRLQVDFYKYIDVCAVTKYVYLIDAQNSTFVTRSPIRVRTATN